MEAGAADFFARRAVEQDVLLGFFERRKWLAEIYLIFIRGELDEFVQILRGGAGAHSAIEQRL